MRRSSRCPTPGLSTPLTRLSTRFSRIRSTPLLMPMGTTGSAFRLALIRDPRLAGVVNDVVVEFGTARYQDLMDRFIGGEEIPRFELRRVWEDTTQIEFDWDLPIYE